MGALGPTLVYLLCLAASVLCAVLLLQTRRQTRSRLLFWAALGFVSLAINNLFLVADVVVFPAVNLWPWRQLASAVTVGVLLYGFVWETDR